MQVEEEEEQEESKNENYEVLDKEFESQQNGEFIQCMMCEQKFSDF